MNLDSLDVLIEEIERQKNRIKKSTPFLDNRLSVFELVKCWDNIFVLVSFLLDKKDKEESHYRNLFDYISTGTFDALKLFLDQSTEKLGCPLISADQKTIRWSNTVLINLGHIGYITRFIDFARQNLFSVYRENNTFTFVNQTRNPGREYFGAQDFYWCQKNINEIDINEKRLEELKPIIDKQLADEVNLWKKSFIKYGCTPELDEYYDLLANYYSQHLHSFDAFPSEVKFGNLTFGEIRLIIEALIGYALKHKDHCLALLKKTNYKVNPWNFYTVPYSLSDLAYSISIHKDLNEEDVFSILNALTLSKDNISILGDSPGDSAPPLVKISRTQVLQSIAGSLSNPFSFFRRSLKLSFEKDYFKAVNAREAVFLNELNDLLISDFIYNSSKSINIKENGKIITDIDAILFDEANKCLLLVQLKWYDDFSTSASRRFSMAKNFYESSIKWIEKTQNWISQEKAKQLLSRLNNVKKIKSPEIETIELLIIGRNFSHFSDKIEDKRAIWCSWYKLRRVIEEHPVLKNNLFELTKYLKENSLENETMPVVSEMDLQVGKYKIRFKI